MEDESIHPGLTGEPPRWSGPPANGDLKPEDIDAALKWFWDEFQCLPRVTYVGPSWCRRLAKDQPDRILRRTHFVEGRTWEQIADECPPNCIIVLCRDDRNDELTFGYMECP